MDELMGVQDEKPPSLFKILKNRVGHDTVYRIQRNLGYSDRLIYRRWKSSRLPFIAPCRLIHSSHSGNLD